MVSHPGAKHPTRIYFTRAIKGVVIGTRGFHSNLLASTEEMEIHPNLHVATAIFLLRTKVSGDSANFSGVCLPSLHCWYLAR